MKGITGIGHVAIRVKDVDRTLDFYVNKLGFREMFRLDRDDRLWIVYLRITDGQFLEVFPDATGDSVPGPDAVGYNHLCLEVDDIDTVVRQLEEAGVALTREKKMGADNNLQAWIADPDGHRIELMQIMPGCMQAEAIARLGREAVTA